VTRLAPFASLALLVAMAIVLVQNRGLVPLAILLALAALVAARQRFGAVARAAVAGPAAAALALAGWAILSAAWAIGAREALAGGLRLAAMVLVLGVILATVPEAPEARRRLGRAVLAAALLGDALVAVEFAFGAPINNALRLFPHPPRPRDSAKPAATFLALLVGPAMAAAHAEGGVRLALAAGLAIAAAVAASTAEAARIAVVLALAAGGLALLRPALVRRALPAGLALVVLAGPPVLGEAAAAAARAGLLPLSALHRLLIWDHAAERAAERPLLGFGMDAARSLPGGADRPDAARLDRLGIEGEIRAFFATGPAHAVHLLPLHTHSMPLQVRLELGLVGLALFAVFAYRCGRAVAALPSGAAFAAGTAAATAASGVGLLSYGVWQHWWWDA
jgi:hypothetical protein